MFKPSFMIDGHTYFPSPDGMYLNENKIVCCTFLEGISTPLSHANVEKITTKKIVIDPRTGEEKSIDVTTIKGLKYDSKIVSIITNREMSKNLTRTNENDNYIPLIFLSQILFGAVHTIILFVLSLKVFGAI